MFLNETYVPLHVKNHHAITHEYVCTYKDCGKKFTNMQDLTYHLGKNTMLYTRDCQIGYTSTTTVSSSIETTEHQTVQSKYP